MSGAFTQETNALRQEIEEARSVAVGAWPRPSFGAALKLRIMAACERWGNKQVCEAIGLHPNIPYQWKQKGLKAPTLEEAAPEEKEETMPEETQESQHEVEAPELEQTEEGESEPTADEASQGEAAPVGDLACEVVLPNGIIIRCFR